ncbi:PspC domain-containing protein [Actinopolymorpha pittospori]|uniref:Phage shock protein PspC (Stress-responsive transcriptional regulator) n=1 Tax=Actinopolymorpha pittospori TaxID=648752 RepID=A0A927MVI9_9ACTN|nr:PspC domain-containing protein [Actinopolymorpha pittospori]MBE1607671.1 phage shock protein PspC (stress-responsive transcriptional regulator) [Actinopolymorpha pittospori]
MPDMTPPADRSESAGRDDPGPEGATSDDAPPADHTAPDGGGSGRHDGLLGEVRRLRRIDEGHVLGGVCAGLGRQLGIDPVVLRVVLAVLAPFGGVGIILYGTGWLLMPQDRGEESILEQQLGRRRNGSPDNAIFVGAVVVLGLVAVSIPWWGLPWHVPALLVLSVLGLLALLRRAGSDPADRTQHADTPNSADAPSTPPSAASPSTAPPSDASSAAGDQTAATRPLATTSPAYVSRSVADAMSDTRPIATRPVDTSSAENAAADDTQPIKAGPTAPSETTPSDATSDDTRPEDTKPIDVRATDAPTGAPSGHEPTTVSSPIGAPTDPTQPVVQLGSWRNAPPAPPAFWDQTDPLGLNAVPNPTGDEGEPPPVPPPALPELKRRRFWLFATTISAAAIVCGAMAAVEESTTVPGRSAPMIDIPAAGYVAAALAVVGLGLIVGTWFGRSRALVAIGVVLALALVPLSAAEKWMGTSANIVHRPTSVGQIEPSYEFSAGRILLDLRKVPFRDGQPVRSSSIDMGTGDVTVLVPPDVDVHASGDVGVGDLRLLGQSSGGMDNSLVVTDLGSDGQGGGRLDLTIDLGVGEVEVNRG